MCLPLVPEAERVSQGCVCVCVCLPLVPEAEGVSQGCVCVCLPLVPEADGVSQVCVCVSHWSQRLRGSHEGVGVSLCSLLHLDQACRPV